VNLPEASKRKFFIWFREFVRAIYPGEIPRKKPLWGRQPPNPRLPFFLTASCGASWVFPVNLLELSFEFLTKMNVSNFLFLNHRKVFRHNEIRQGTQGLYDRMLPLQNLQSKLILWFFPPKQLRFLCLMVGQINEDFQVHFGL